MVAAVLFVLASVSGSCAHGPGIEEPAHGESILDRTEHVEPTLLTDIPATFRWCDRIAGLDKRKIDVGGAELYVEAEGNGTPLVLINGGPGGTHHYFHPWFSRARTFAKIVYYDQRGCGLSDFKPGKEGYSVEQAAGDLDAVRRALGIEKWVVLGYSYGGFLAQLYTVLHPEHVSGLILLGASPGTKADTGRSRQREFITEAERNRMSEVRKELNGYSESNKLSRQKHVELLLYNLLLNGDWKRQNFYRPSPDRLAQGALYEWVHDENFNGIMGQSQAGWDFTGAFARNPIPTLILEGKWDLTWGEKKDAVLKSNHPGARMIVFERASHGIYDEDPDGFFRALESFVTRLPAVDDDALGVFERIVARFGGDPRMKAYGLIWQGHMLDLLGKRAEAVSRYRQAAALNVTDSLMHGQYGMKYELSPYARERVKVPFTRIENTSID